MILKLIELVKLLPCKTGANLNNWNFNELSENPNIFPEDIKSYIEYLKTSDIKLSECIISGSDDRGDILYPFNRNNLIQNTNITLEFILKYLNPNWNWRSLSTKLSLEEIASHPDLNWNFERLSERSDITLKIVELFPDKKWDWGALTRYINPKIIFEHSELPWNYSGISFNKNITLAIFKLYDLDKLYWNNSNLSRVLPLDDIKSQPEIWDYTILSNNPHLTTEFIIQNLDKDWEWLTLLARRDLDFDLLADIDMIKILPTYGTLGDERYDVNLNSYFSVLLFNPNVTLKFFIKYLEQFLSAINTTHFDGEIGIIQISLSDPNIYNKIKLEDIQTYPMIINGIDPRLQSTFLSINHNLTIEYVLERKEWNYHMLSVNPAFKVKDIIRGIELGIPWDYSGLSQNPNITFDFIYENKEKDWNYWLLSKNLYLEQNRINKNNLLKDHIIEDVNTIILQY